MRLFKKRKVTRVLVRRHGFRGVRLLYDEPGCTRSNSTTAH